MSIPDQDPQNFATFEVTVPRDNPDIALALRALAQSHGLNVRQRPAFYSDLNGGSAPDSSPVTNTNLIDTSLELWQTDLYGQVAVGWMNNWRYRSVHAYGNGRHRSVDNPLRDTSCLTDSELLKEAWQRWFEMDPVPFGPNIQRVTDLQNNGCIRVSSATATRASVAEFVRRRGYDQHGLHGTLGKTFDVFSVVGGVKIAADVKVPEIETTYLSQKELGAAMAAFKLTHNAKSAIKSAIQGGLYTQLRNGKPKNGMPEIIIEGNVGVGARDYDRVATVSLGILATTFREGSSARSFLQQFA